ncbi:MAG: 5-deoxy-glucuronate isomerase [Armatimonadetes bacterium]|nr:5-deoxy-glucuronate isomerase [Armatimonadota bacterium]MDW8122876.1 5-deoxy-glucuronate isomerase [Armatimonadota bacterium]
MATGTRWIHKPTGSGWLPIASPADGILQWLTFHLLILQPDEDLEGVADGETAATLLFGQVTVEADGLLWSKVGNRRDVFSGKATAFFFPHTTRFRIRAHTAAELAFFSAPAQKVGQPQLISPDQVARRSAGRRNWYREIDDIIGPSFPAARLLVGETRNPPGNWSSFPPHRHQENRPPFEAELEEIYHFRIHPPKGFAVQILMDDDKEEALLVRDGDTVLIPRGYHPVVAAPGCQVYYLWCLAGEGRSLYVTNHPDFDWITSVEALLND